MRKYQVNTGCGVGLMFFIFMILCIAGWVMNIYNVIVYVSTDVTLADIHVVFVVQVIGIFFAPLGVVLGWVL